MEKAAVHIFVSGLVQGVFFRFETLKVSQDLGIVGWVKNLADGRVEIMTEGDKEKLEKLVAWSKRGPPLARVDNLQVVWEEYRGEFNSFLIL